MKTLRKYNIKGFSLIELMVVVAIIGILSAIAIPNFNRFQRKARQAEAKSSLGGLYTAEKAFLAEWESYHSDFAVIGFTLDGQLRYNTGFAAGDAPCAIMNGNIACNPAAGTYTGVNGTMEANTTGACGMSLPDCTSAANALPGGVVAPTLTVFTAGAAGAIGGAMDDHWTINQSKLLSNTQSGL